MHNNIATVSTLGCACNQAGNQDLVNHILAGMDDKSRVLAKKNGKKKALSALLGPRVLAGPNFERSVVGMTEGGAVASMGALIVGAVIVTAGVGAAVGAGVAAVVAKPGQKPQYMKGAAIGAGGIFALGILSAFWPNSSRPQEPQIVSTLPPPEPVPAALTTTAATESATPPLPSV